MATTLASITQYLDNRGWKYYKDIPNSRIITGVQLKNVEDFLISLQLTENGEFLQIIAPKLLHVNDSVYKGVLFQTMLAISWEVKMLRFEYDRIDGEIRASIELPLEDSPLTERQFNRALEGLIDLVDRVAMPRLKTVLATGSDPGTKSLASSLLDAIPEEVLNLLQEALAIRQQQHDS